MTRTNDNHFSSCCTFINTEVLTSVSFSHFLLYICILLQKWNLQVFLLPSILKLYHRFAVTSLAYLKWVKSFLSVEQSIEKNPKAIYLDHGWRGFLYIISTNNMNFNIKFICIYSSMNLMQCQWLQWIYRGLSVSRGSDPWRSLKLLWIYLTVIYQRMNLRFVYRSIKG